MSRGAALPQRADTRVLKLHKGQNKYTKGRAAKDALGEGVDLDLGGLLRGVSLANNCLLPSCGFLVTRNYVEAKGGVSSRQASAWLASCEIDMQFQTLCEYFDDFHGRGSQLG